MLTSTHKCMLQRIHAITSVVRESIPLVLTYFIAPTYIYKILYIRRKYKIEIKKHREDENLWSYVF